MKTSKIITAITSLTLVFFMSVTSIANTVTASNGEIVKSVSVAELAPVSMDYLRFDVNNFIEDNGAEITELPVENEFDYLRFDVNNFDQDKTTDYTEIPVNEFDYLRFDVNKFTSENNDASIEMPANELS